MRTHLDSSPDDAPLARHHHPSLVRPASRRSFVGNAAAIAAALSLGCSDSVQRAFAPTAANTERNGENDDEGGDDDRLPSPERSGIEQIVLVMMENRSFDHLLGWVPRADGRQAGLFYTDNDGIRHATRALAPDFQGCGHPDPDHSYAGGRIQYNGGRMDGFLRSGENDEYAIGYYRKHDLPFLGRAVPDWTTSDRYFCAILGPTFPNRIYQHAGQTDRLSNTLALSTLPTIWDRLAAAGVSGKYYFSDLPATALWGAKYLSITQPVTQFFADAAAGTLPHVSFVDPSFLGEDEGTSNDDHPHADIREGEDFLNRIYRAITTSPQWKSTVLIVNFDEWGGFFDHVPPPVAPTPDSDRAVGNVDGLRGIRTPFLVVSPFARRDYVDHRVLDHTSVLRMIEWRWGLEPLTIRDRTANNIAEVLDFRHPSLHAPQYLVPSVVGAACPATSSLIASADGGLATATRAFGAVQAAPTPWRALAKVARTHGFDLLR